MTEYDLENLILTPEQRKPPSWRWFAVMEHKAEWMRPLDSTWADEHLSAAIRFQRNPQDYHNRTYYRRVYPELMEAFDIHNNNRPNSYKWLMEAMIMGRMDDDEIARHLKLEHVETVDWYKALFFDVDSYLDSPLCVQANILSTSLVRIHDFNDYDYTWKIMAYKWPDAFIEFVSPGGRLQAQVKDWLGNMVEQEISWHSFHLTSDLRMLYNEQAMDIFQLAIKHWDVKAADKERTEDSFMEDVAKQLMGCVEMSIARSDRRLGAIEEDRGFEYNDQLKFFVHQQNSGSN